MTVPASTNLHARNPLVLAVSACPALALCVLIACAASVGLWLYARSDVRAPAVLTAEMIRAEVQALAAGNPRSGEQLFTTMGCRSCHSLEQNIRLVGPSLSGIASSAATRKPDYTAEMYIYESIVAPRAFVVPGFSGDVMPAGFSKQLSRQKLADLLAFLMGK